MAEGGQVERFVVVSACGEHRAIAQSRCLGLTGTDIHIYKRGMTMHHDCLPRLLARQSSAKRTVQSGGRTVGRSFMKSEKE